MAKNKTTIKYDSNFRPATSYEQKYNKETGLWEVSGAKPKSTPVKQTTKSNKVEPIYVDNPKDKRLQAYNDSLSLYKKEKKVYEGSTKLSYDKLLKYPSSNGSPKYGYTLEGNPLYGYKKPVQPVIYKKEEVKVPVPKKDFSNLEELNKIDILGNNVQYQQEPQEQQSNKGNPIPDYLIQLVKAPNGMKTYIRKDRNSPWIEQYKYGGKIKKLAGGGIIGADGKSETQSQGMGAGAITGIVGNALDTVGNFIPVDNDGRGVSKKGQAISGGIQTGLDSAADIANSIPGGQIVGGALKIGSFLTKGITAIVDAVKEKRNPTDELVNEKYSPTYKDSAFSFGQMALGGNVATDSKEQFKQYDAPSHRDDGQMIDKNNNPTGHKNKAVAEIEKKENSYKNYVFSYELGFAKLAAKINKKYDGREDLISKNTLDIELTGLMKKNEKVKQQIQQSQQLAQAVLEYVGNIPKMSKGGFNDYPSWLSDIPQYEYQSGAADGTGLSNYGFNKNIDGTPAIAPKSLQEATIRVGEQYLPLVKDYPSFIQPQLLDYKYNSGRSIKDLLLYSQGKISLADINGKNNYDKDYDTKYKSDIEKAMSDNPEEFYKKLVQARHDVAKTTKGYSLDNPNPAYEKTWKNRIDNFKYGDEQGGKGIAVSSKNNKAKLPYEEGYVNQLMETGVSVPPINWNMFKNNEETPVVGNSELKDDANFYKEGQVGTAIPEKEKKQFSPEAIAGYGIKGIEMLGHAIQAFKKPDYVKPVYNPEENKVKSLMSNRKFDSQAILDALDLQDTANRQNISDNSTSVGVTQANLQKANANQVNAIANTKIQEQQTNNQYRADEAQVLNNLGQQKMQAQVYAEDVNAKSKANVQNQRDKFLKESIGGLGDFLLKKDYVNKDNEFQMNILKSKGINFTPTDYNDWNKAGVDIAKFTGELESETDTAKRKAKMEEVHQKFLAKGGTEESWQSNSIAQGLTNKYLK